MSITIVKDILDKTKELIQVALPDYKPLDYEYDINRNADNRLQKRFGFTPFGAEFIEARTNQHNTFNHVFQLVLTNSFQAMDDDTALATALNELYEKSFLVQQNIQAGDIILTNPDYKVLIFNAVSFEQPDFLVDNGTVALRSNFSAIYRFRKT